MNRTLNTASAILFYTLGGTFFLCYVLLRNNIGGAGPGWWMQVADLPLLLSAMLYGGTSLYRSLLPEDRSSTALGVAITVPLVLLFVALALLNFWPAVAPMFGL